MNEDEMAEMEVRAGEQLERVMARYARVRLDPSAAQAKRARDSVMAAAWRLRLDGPPGVVGEEAASRAPSATASRRHAPFAGWGTRRLGGSLAAAVLAGLLVGTSAFAASRAGGPLYDARIALEELTLPVDATARLEAELALAQGRLAEIVEAVAKDDPQAVAAAVDGYLAALDDLAGATGGPADRALIAIQFHRSVLLEVLARVPDDARAGIEIALASSGRVIERLDAAGTTPPGAGAGGGSGRGNEQPGPNPGSGAGGGAGAGGGSTSGGEGGKPSKDPTPARTPSPARTPAPARTADPVETEATKTPKPRATEEAPDGAAGGDQGKRDTEDGGTGQGSRGGQP